MSSKMRIIITYELENAIWIKCFFRKKTVYFCHPLYVELKKIRNLKKNSEIQKIQGKKSNLKIRNLVLSCTNINVL